MQWLAQFSCEHSALWSQDIHGIPLLVFPGAAPGHFPIIAEALRHFVDEKAAVTHLQDLWITEPEIRHHQKSWVPAQPQDFLAACLNEMSKVTSTCLLGSCYIFQMLLKFFPAALLLPFLLFFLRDCWAISLRVMLFHSRLKENLLCAVFLFSKIIFFNRTTRLLSYQLHQLIWSLWWKTDLLLGINYAVKTVLNLTACLLSAGRGWHALHSQYSDHRSLQSRFRQHLHLMLSTPWWCIWNARWEMCAVALGCVVFLLMARVDSAALILHCKVAWEFWVSA